ncbi:MAG TPA: hypothetical protein VJK07_01630 [Candidatus Nanoarchaeia archaeon]|nr:hypothetical protein [Candidatus Nanoarchaeia archaeon]
MKRHTKKKKATRHAKHSRNASGKAKHSKVRKIKRWIAHRPRKKRR